MGLIWGLISAWLIDLVAIRDSMNGDYSVLYLSVRTLIDCLLVWTLAGGIAEYADVHYRHDLAGRAVYLRAAYLALCIGAMIWLLSGGASRNQLAASSLLIFPAAFWGIAWIVWLVMILRLVGRVRREVAAHDELLALDAARPWQYSLRTLMLTPLALWLLLMACFPKLMTGDFCTIRIEKLSIHDNGQVELNYITRTSSGTTERERCLPGGGGGSGSGSSFPIAWPCEGSSGSSFTLSLDGSRLTAREIRRCFLVEQGGAPRGARKPLYFYDYTDKAGTRNCSYLEVEHGSRLGF